MGAISNIEKLDNLVHVTDFGAVGDGVTDDTLAIQSAINSTAASGYTLFFPSGVYRTTQPLTIINGTKIVGDGPQTYGEFYQAKPSTILSSAATILVSVGTTRSVHIEGMNFEGTWLNDGMSIGATSREFTLFNVSFKKVKDGIIFDDLFVTHFDKVTITCRNYGFWSKGAGTTVTYTACLVQGDKENSTRAKFGWRYDQSGTVTGAMPTNSLTGCAAQYVESCFFITGSPSIETTSFNAEDWTDSAFYIKDTFKATLILNNALLAAPDATAILKFDGVIQSLTRVFVTVPAFYDHWWLATPGTRKFAAAAGTLVTMSGSIHIDAYVWGVIRNTVDTAIYDKFIISPVATKTSPDAIMLTGATSYSVPISTISMLYRNLAVVNAAGQLLVNENLGEATGNGHAYKISTNLVNGAYSCFVSAFSLRTVSGSERFALNNWLGTLPFTVTYNNTTKALDITGVPSTAQVIFITPLGA